MKGIVLVIGLSIVSVGLSMPSFAVSGETRALELKSNAFELKKANALMISGIVLTSIGIAGELTGGGIMIAGAADPRNRDKNKPTMSPGIDYVYGGIVMGISAVPLGVGIPLWITGKMRKNRIVNTAIIPRLSLVVDTASNNYMLRARWRF